METFLPLAVDHEQELLSRIRNGDQSAENRLLCHYQPFIKQVIHKHLQDHPDSEDYVQEALLKIWQSLPKFSGQDKLTNWMHSIIRKTIHEKRHQA